MADVQPDQFTRIANELLESIAKFKFNGTQFRIIMVVWRYTYGFQRKECELSLSYLSQATGINKDQIKRELNTLIEKNVLTVVEEASFNKTRKVSFNKDYEQWEIDHSELNSNQGAKKTTGVKKEPETGGKLAHSTGGELAHQERKNKEIKKERQSSHDDGPTASNLIKEFHDRFLEKFGAKPMINGGKHGKLLKGLLSNYTYEDIKRYISMYFDDNEDKFIKDSGYSVEAFVTKIQKYVLKKSKPKFEPIDEWAEFERKQQRDLERWG